MERGNKSFFSIILLTLPFLAVVVATKGWELGNGYRYKALTTVVFKESGPSKFGADVGFQLTGELDVHAVWRDPQDAERLLLKIKFLSPQLWIKSRKAPEPEGYVEHTSRIDETAKRDVLVLWRNGDIEKMFADSRDDVSSLNFKRGLVSFLQYKTLDGEFRERDASGLCNVTYSSASPSSISKTKNSCWQDTLPPKIQHPNPLFAVNTRSSRKSVYELNHILLPTKVADEEEHETFLSARPEAGTVVRSYRILQQSPGTLRSEVVTAGSLRAAVLSLGEAFQETRIDLQLESGACPDSGCPTIPQVIEENRDALTQESLGQTRSALAFLKLLPLVREAKAEELLKLLKSPRYNDVKPQLLDVLGAAATVATHHVAMNYLRQDDLGDDTERYLWALSMAPNPHPDVIKDVLKRSEETLQNDKVSETLALTAAALSRQSGVPSIVEQARVSLELGLESCSGEDCRLKFLRALRNLGSEAAIPVFLSYAVDGTRATSIVAWRALNSLPKNLLTPEVRKLASRTFYQLGTARRPDSSVRTQALDIILETNPGIEELRGLLRYLSTRDRVYEVAKYLTQRLQQVSSKDEEFRHKLTEAFQLEAREVNNYDVLAQKGLSTAFTRDFLNSKGSNGSLVTVQEVQNGLLKRGIVDVVLQSQEHESALFSLGLFAGGLGSFVSSGSSEETTESAEVDDTATAGMEIDLLGVGVRPFVFFTGQGELMGHVWSGTASERTPAFQLVANVYRYREFLPLMSGFVADLEVEGAMSFDLAGQIQLSLWSRNAQSLVEMAAGVAVKGGSKIRSSFIQSMAEFLMSLEPKLELSTDVDFSSNVALCMRLTQPESTAKYQIYKVERIPGSRHRLRKTRRMRIHVPPRSYLLNRKNNEMCSKLFS